VRALERHFHRLWFLNSIESHQHERQTMPRKLAFCMSILVFPVAGCGPSDEIPKASEETIQQGTQFQKEQMEEQMQKVREQQQRGGPRGGPPRGR
jgi:hypothetical protein